MKKTISWGLMAAGCLSMVGLGARHLNLAKSASAANAGFIYGNNAGGTPYVLKITPGTFAVADSYTNLSGSNGRGVVVVNGIMYYTSASTPNVFSYNTATKTNNGSSFVVAGASALSTMAFDGTNFWIGDYSGTNQAFSYSPTGTLLKTIHLSGCRASCDGLEYFVQNGNARLISNEGDAVGPYDVYDTNGTMITPSFITTGSNSPTGIAYDGTNFYVSYIFTAALGYYSGTTGAFISQNTITGAPNGFAPLIEDLSADYAITLGVNPTPTAIGTPTLSEFGLLLCALLLLGSGIYMDRRNHMKR